MKYRLVQPDSGLAEAGGRVERIGEPGGRLEHHPDGGPDAHELPGPYPDHAAAIDGVLAAFAGFGPALDAAAPVAVGHRVVHGGPLFRDPVIVDDAVLDRLEHVSALAPLHNPAALAAIRTARRAVPGVPHVAVFDTAFHAGIPPRAATYAVPAGWRRDHAVRRYGFHGISYAFVSRQAALLLGRDPVETNLIVLHLGNGASACAVSGGRSIDTSMGMTPMQGLVMGSRSGDVDPGLPAYLARVAGLSAAEVDDALNHASGLLGLAGGSDVRELTARVAAGDGEAAAALEIYCYRIRGYVGAYYAALGRVDAVVFTAGVGENSATVRRRSLDGLGRLGIVVDESRNDARSDRARRISPDGAEVAVLVVPTDEEREIALQALAVCRG